MYQSLIIIDDFLDNAQPLREMALKLDYPEQAGNYPGRNSVQRLNIQGLEQAASMVVQEPLKAISPLESHSKCRISLEGEGGGGVHIDQSHWSGILFLNTDDQCQGGTVFHRHKRTNSDRAPTTPQELEKMGLKKYEDVYDVILQNDSLDYSKWDEIMTVPMRFNRLIMFRPHLWHNAGPGFGDSIENGRLVYLMFFSPAKG